MLKSGTAPNAIADREGLSKSHVARIIPLATLSPGSQETVVTGTRPLGLTLETLVRTRLPPDRRSQEKRFGFTA